MPSFFLTALNFLLSVIDWRSPSSRSALALTSRSATATAQRARAASRRLERDRRHQRASDHDQRRLTSLSRPANYRPLSPSPSRRTISMSPFPGGEVWPTQLPLRVPDLHGSTKLAGEGRLWMMRCAPLTRSSPVGLLRADLAAGAPAGRDGLRDAAGGLRDPFLACLKTLASAIRLPS
jgi:hypothetical protein